MSDRADGAAPPAVAERERRARSRLWWATRPGLGLKAAVVVLLGGLVLTGWLLLRPPPGQIHRPPAPQAESVPATGTPAEPAPGPGAGAATGDGAPGDLTPVASETQLVVHVAGAVAEPGLVTLPAGARIADAIEAAGGPTPEAMLGAVNLAAPARDGEQIYVPTPEESPPPSAGAAVGADDAAPVDLNHADAAALETLPGIGPVTAERILDWRTEHGPFGAVSDLLAVPGIGPATLARIEDRVRT